MSIYGVSTTCGVDETPNPRVVETMLFPDLEGPIGSFLCFDQKFSTALGAVDLFREGFVARQQRHVEPLTDEQIAAEEQFLKGLPRINWGAFLMPPIWGPAHGIWVTILYYPLWLLADNVMYGAFATPSFLTIAIAAVVFVFTLGVTIAFAIVSQPYAAHRAEARGVSREAYLRRERWWIFISAIIAVVFLALATYYNLTIRPTLEV